MEYSLALTFICTDGEKSTLTIDGVKSDLTQEKIEALMDTIIANNVFFNKNGEYTEKESASLLQIIKRPRCKIHLGFCYKTSNWLL